MEVTAVDSTGLSAHRVVSAGKKNFNALTGLRFFAAIGVVFYHFAGTLGQNWPSFFGNWIGSGFVAVGFFYLLSGFVLSYSYVTPQGDMRGSRRAFWTARFARIYPAYLLAFLLAAPYNALWTLHVNTPDRALLKLGSGAVAVLTMQQAWTPWTAWYWNYPAWSVSAEAFFYLSFPFAALALKRFSLRACLVGMGVLWFLALIPPTLFLLYPGVSTGARSHLEMAIEFTPLLRLPEFLIGLLLGRAYVLGFRFRPTVARWISYLSVAAVLACLAYSEALPRPLLANGVLAPLFALIIFSFAEGEGWLARFLSIRPLVLLGEASYGIYILQIPVSYVLRLPPPHRSWVMLSMFLFALIATSLLSWRFVEIPLRGRIRDWIMGNQAKRPAVLGSGISANSRQTNLIVATAETN
ncbi:MAG TPA: acyltransferase [Bryobacteraceae bacterium]|nr:acyltransferase [Bryobacteraceae bacterium]